MREEKQFSNVKVGSSCVVEMESSSSFPSFVVVKKRDNS